MGPYYDAPMVDERPAVHGRRATSPTCSADARVRVRRASEAAARRAVLAEPQFHRAALSRGSTAIPRHYTDLYADCAFESCPDEPPHPWFAGGKPAIDEGARERARQPDRLFRRGDRDGCRHRPRARRDRARRASTQSTLVIFMSDNGMNCGHHGIWGKGNGTRPQNMYDTSVKVPCIIAQPGRIPPAASATICCRGYDVFPTLLDYLGLADAPDRAASPGRSFAAAPRRRRRVPAATARSWSTTNTVRCAWCARASGSTCTAIPDGPHELFDLADDPGRADQPGRRPGARTRASAAMRGRLEAWFRALRRSARDGVDKGVTGCGQLGRVEEATPSARCSPTSIWTAPTGTCGCRPRDTSAPDASRAGSDIDPSGTDGERR